MKYGLLVKQFITYNLFFQRLYVHNSLVQVFLVDVVASPLVPSNSIMNPAAINLPVSQQY